MSTCKANRVCKSTRCQATCSRGQVSRTSLLKGRRGKEGDRGTRGARGPRGFPGRSGAGPVGRRGAAGPPPCQTPSGPVQIINLTALGAGDPVDPNVFGTLIFDILGVSGSSTHTLGDGTCVGQLKEITTNASSGSDVNKQISFNGGALVADLDPIGASMTLQWNGSIWVIIDLVNGSLI